MTSQPHYLLSLDFGAKSYLVIATPINYQVKPCRHLARYSISRNYYIMCSITIHVKFLVDKSTRITGEKRQTPWHHFGAKWVHSETQYAEYFSSNYWVMIEI